jgi:hypothetical protein
MKLIFVFFTRDQIGFKVSHGGEHKNKSGTNPEGSPHVGIVSGNLEEIGFEGNEGKFDSI